jgi:PASTA domain
MTDDPLRYLDALSAPMGDLIASVGRGVAEAQQALDMGSLGALMAIYADADDQTLALLREIDYRPTFYAIPEVTSELTVALTLTGQSSSSGPAAIASAAAPLAALPAALPAASVAAAPLAPATDSARLRLYVAPVDAGYQNRYGFDLRATSSLKFKIVPVPPPSQTEQLRVVPNLVGRSFAEARTVLDLYRLAWAQPAPAAGDPPLPDPAGTDVVLTQSATPGALVRAGDVLTLSFGPPGP